jgi:hypothetical protein
MSRQSPSRTTLCNPVCAPPGLVCCHRASVPAQGTRCTHALAQACEQAEPVSLLITLVTVLRCFRLLAFPMC